MDCIDLRLLMLSKILYWLLLIILKVIKDYFLTGLFVGVPVLKDLREFCWIQGDYDYANNLALS